MAVVWDKSRDFSFFLYFFFVLPKHCYKGYFSSFATSLCTNGEILFSTSLPSLSFSSATPSSSSTTTSSSYYFLLSLFAVLIFVLRRDGDLEKFNLVPHGHLKIWWQISFFSRSLVNQNVIWMLFVQFRTVLLFFNWVTSHFTLHRIYW